MPTISGIVRGAPGPVIDTSHTSSVGNEVIADITESPVVVPLSGNYRNTGNVDQTITVTPDVDSFTANIVAVSVDLGNGSNTRVLSPNQSAQPIVTIEVTIPETPAEVEAPANQEAVSFDLDQVWS